MLENQQGGILDLCKHAAADVIPATEEYVKDAWGHKAQFVKHVGSEALSAITFGITVGSLLPSKGPAGYLVAAGFAVPTIYHAIKGVKDANDEAQLPGADREKIAHGLARNFVDGTVDFGINMASGIGGTEAGYGLSRTENILGRASQASQRGILKAENESILYARDTFLSGAAIEAKMDAATGSSASGRFGKMSLTSSSLESAEALKPPVFTARAVEAEQLPMMQRPLAKLARRVDQYAAVKENSAQATGTMSQFTTYRATFHGHTKYDDGMGTAEENYAKAKEGKLDIAFLTPHNHDGARQGVGPDDPRAGAEAGVPILAQTPAEYADIINAAKAASEPGKFYAGYGIEAGTIGPGGHDHGSGGDHGGEHGASHGDDHGADHGNDHDHGSAGGPDNGKGKGKGKKDAGPDVSTTPAFMLAPESPLAAQMRGLSERKPGATAVLEAPVSTTTVTASNGTVDGTVGAPFDPLEAARQTHHGGVNHVNIFGITTDLIVTDRQPHGIAAAFNRFLGRNVPVPDVKHYPDGNYAALADILGTTTDVTGKPPIVQFNHPRWNSNGSTDYGVTSFPNKQAWLDNFATPFVRLQEVVKGEALNASPVVDAMKPGDFDPGSFAGYMDMGVHAGPTYGRDSHFGDPGGRPAGTGVLATQLDEAGVYDAMRNRRTFATTNYAELQGVLTANNDSIYMGTVLDQAAVPSLNLKLKVAGNIQPDAKYEIKLMADEQIGDGKLAAPLKTVTMSGADLLKANQEVAFDPIVHKLGNQSGYYIEVSKTASGQTSPDRMLTAPIWVEPLSGAKHGLFTRALVGNGAQYITSPWIPKF